MASLEITTHSPSKQSFVLITGEANEALREAFDLSFEEYLHLGGVPCPHCECRCPCEIADTLTKRTLWRANAVTETGELYFQVATGVIAEFSRGEGVA